MRNRSRDERQVFISRRELVQQVGFAIATAPFGYLIGCSSSDSTGGNATAAGGSGTTPGAGGAAGGSTLTGNGGAVVGAGGTVGSAGGTVGSAGGGVASMGGNASASGGSTGQAGATGGSAGTSAGGGSPGADAGSGGSAMTSNDAGAGGSGDAGASTTGWANGGTDLITGGYPDPFASGSGSACDLTCSQTLGPCYAMTMDRMDVSEGQKGLPMRLSFLVLNQSCEPVPGATVDIWHTAARGVYSGNDSVSMCTLNDAEALASRFFRGVQTADANGRVDFNTCFPGWYTGRTIHVHVTVRVNDTEYVTTQFYFDDDLNDDILTNHPLYNNRGRPDTTNATDGIIPRSRGPYQFETTRASNGVLLASKRVIIRSSAIGLLCSA